MMGDSSAYKSTLDCFIKTLKNDGPFAFYKGFIPNFGRLGSWNVIMFLTLEQVKATNSSDDSFVVLLHFFLDCNSFFLRYTLSPSHFLRNRSIVGLSSYLMWSLLAVSRK
ncbi:unnamed protein product [Camellia sinensis]